MTERARPPVNVIRDVRSEARNRCAICGRVCDGIHYVASVHHKKKLGDGGSNRRENLIVLCRRIGTRRPGDDPGCHDRYDKKAKQGISVDEALKKREERLKERRKLR